VDDRYMLHHSIQRILYMLHDSVPWISDICNKTMMKFHSPSIINNTYCDWNILGLGCKASFTPPHFIEVPVPSQESER